MTPFYFGTGQRRLFGIYDPASLGRGCTRAAVLCQPWGFEYIHAHRSMRQLASKMSLAGFHTLRFDYFGTGDSAGDLDDMGIKSWEADTELAIDEIKDMANVAQVTLVGLRLGATVAATVAVKRPKDVKALVLWDPIFSGSEYLAELLAFPTGLELSARPLVVSSENANELQIGGFRLTSEMAREIEDINMLTTISSLKMRTMIVTSEESVSNNSLFRAVTDSSAGPLEMEYIADLHPWNADPTNMGAIPVNILQRIVQWLA